MDEKLKSIAALMKSVAAEVYPVKLVRRDVVTWMTAEIKKLRRRRNRARRDMKGVRSEWVEICRELKGKDRHSKEGDIEEAAGED